MERPNDPSTVYLESSAVIAEAKGEAGHEPVSRVLEAAVRGTLTLVTSTILLVEARGNGLASALDEEQEKKLREHLDSPRWPLVELDRATAMKARDLALQYRLSNHDAIHLASAIVGEAEVLMTLDRDFPIGQDIEGVWVDVPYPPGGGDLFTS